MVNASEQRQDRGTWVRGEPAVNGDVMRLESLTPYVVADEPRLVFDLAYLSSLEDAIVFARQYGLLHGEREERWSNWEPEVAELRLALLLVTDAQDARGGRASADDVRARWREKLDEATLPDALAALAARHINTRLTGVETRLLPTDAGFALAADAPSLTGHAYQQLVSLAVAGVELSRCRGCGRVFARRHGNEHYHDALCAQRNRGRRHYLRTKGARS